MSLTDPSDNLRSVHDKTGADIFPEPDPLNYLREAVARHNNRLNAIEAKASRRRRDDVLLILVFWLWLLMLTLIA